MSLNHPYFPVREHATARFAVNRCLPYFALLYILTWLCNFKLPSICLLQAQLKVLLYSLEIDFSEKKKESGKY